MKRTINFAHRGASAYCPENTMVSFKRALELGATGIETDVQMTKDGQLVIIHDESLKRTTGDARLIKDITYDELTDLDAGSWFDPSFKGERIPALEQLLELVQNKGTIVNIELKNGIFQYPDIEQKVINMIQAYGMSDQVVISSFNHYSLVTCKEIAPDIRTGILYAEGLYRPWEYAATVQADALHAIKFAVTPEWVEEAAANGVVYHPWTVNAEAEMVQLLNAGVAGIITDYPDRLAKLLMESEAEQI